MLAICRAERTTDFEEPGGALTLRRALALALTRSPALAAVSYDVRAADARVLQARLFPNPESSMATEDIGGFNEESTLQLGQLVELGGKRTARIGEAKAGRALAEFDYEEKKRAVFLETHDAFIRVLAAQRRVEVNEKVVALYEEVLPDIRRRIEAGRTSALEETRSNVAIASAQIVLEQARQDLQTARYRLAAQWGAKKPRFNVAVGNLDEAPPVASLSTLSARLPDHPRLARFTAEFAKREAILKGEQAKAVPNVTLGAGAKHYGDNNTTGLLLGLSVPLPLLNRNQGAIRAAREQLIKLSSERAAVEAGMNADLAEAYHAAQATLKVAELFRSTVLPQGEEALKATREGYNLGRFSYIDLIDAQRTLISARQQYVEALVALQQAIARVENLTGRSVHQSHLR